MTKTVPCLSRVIMSSSWDRLLYWISMLAYEVFTKAKQMFGDTARSRGTQNGSWGLCLPHTKPQDWRGCRYYLVYTQVLNKSYWAIHAPEDSSSGCHRSQNLSQQNKKFKQSVFIGHLGSRRQAFSRPHGALFRAQLLAFSCSLPLEEDEVPPKRLGRSKAAAKWAQAGHQTPSALVKKNGTHVPLLSWTLD